MEQPTLQRKKLPKQAEPLRKKLLERAILQQRKPPEQAALQKVMSLWEEA